MLLSQRSYCLREVLFQQVYLLITSLSCMEKQYLVKQTRGIEQIFAGYTCVEYALTLATVPLSFIVSGGRFEAGHKFHHKNASWMKRIVLLL